MRILGAVLAGGESKRFGSDKAMALFAGQPLLAHVVAALAPQVEAMVICGHDWPPYETITDLPTAGLGPLGGLCAALVTARVRGFDAVLCVPCDTLGLPPDLAVQLGAGPAVALGQRSIGLWPATLASSLLARIASGGRRSLQSWAEACEAREVDCGPLHNINRPEDLA